MKRCCVLALAALVLNALPARAQLESTLPPARVTITPFAGVRVPTIAHGTARLTAPGEEFFAEVREQRSGGPAGGVQLEVNAYRFLSVIGAVAYSRSGEITVAIAEEGGITEGAVDGPDVWFAKAGLSFRLPEPMPDDRRYRSVAFLTLAPALIRESRDWWLLFEGEETGAVNSWGLSVGGEALAAIGPNLALHLGLEDFITFWNTGARRRRHEQFFTDPAGPATARFTYDPSHILLARVGLSVRF